MHTVDLVILAAKHVHAVPEVLFVEKCLFVLVVSYFFRNDVLFHILGLPHIFLSSAVKDEYIFGRRAMNSAVGTPSNSSFILSSIFCFSGSEVDDIWDSC